MRRPPKRPLGPCVLTSQPGMGLHDNAVANFILSTKSTPPPPSPAVSVIPPPPVSVIRRPLFESTESLQQLYKLCMEDLLRPAGGGWGGGGVGWREVHGN